MNAVAQAVFGALVITHQLVDPGLITSAQPASVNAIGHVLLQLGFLGAFVLGRGSHNASLDAIARMQNAMQAAAQKEALLAEARQELDRALAIDAPGRFTDQVFGDYRLGNVIGRGGMGEVYEAWHTGSGAVAAVKLQSRSEAGEPHAVERVLREVRAVRGIDSPQVVRVRGASDENAAVPYLVMERLQGQDLATVLRGGPIAHDALVTMLAQIGAALEQAWARGVVHRDLTPHNIFLCDDGTWKVLDFGVHGARAGARREGRSSRRPLRARGHRLSLAHRPSGHRRQGSPRGALPDRSRHAAEAERARRASGRRRQRARPRARQGSGRALPQRRRAPHRDRERPRRQPRSSAEAPRPGSARRAPVGSRQVAIGGANSWCSVAA